MQRVRDISSAEIEKMLFNKNATHPSLMMYLFFFLNSLSLSLQLLSELLQLATFRVSVTMNVKTLEGTNGDVKSGVERSEWEKVRRVEEPSLHSRLSLSLTLTLTSIRDFTSKLRSIRKEGSGINCSYSTKDLRRKKPWKEEEGIENGRLLCSNSLSFSCERGKKNIINLQQNTPPHLLVYIRWIKMNTF